MHEVLPRLAWFFVSISVLGTLGYFFLLPIFRHALVIFQNLPTCAWIGWRSITQRWTSSWLTILSMALGVALVVAVLLILGVVSDSFRNSSNLGYNIIVGAKGSPLQLVLNSIYYLDRPVENIPYSYYQEFLTPAQLAEEHYLGDDVAQRQELLHGGGGKFAGYTLRAIPISMGDYYQKYCVVGTIPAFFEDYEDELGSMPRQYRFAEGRNFKVWDDEHQYFEGVVGATVARETGIKVGDTFNPSHGAPGGHPHSPFTVVGVLKPTGTPADRAVFVNLEGFYLMDGHAKPPPKDEEELNGAAPKKKAPKPKAARPQPLPLVERELSAVLLRTDPAQSPGLTNEISEGYVAQAALPVREIFGLFKLWVEPFEALLLVITLLICLVSGIGILVAIYNSMSERRREIAIMRALGARAEVISGIVLLESTILSLGGGLCGWIGGRVLILALNPWIEERTGVAVNIFRLTPSFWAGSGYPIISWLPSEVLLVVGLIVLAIAVGTLPAYVAAYQTDVSKSLQN